MNIVYRILTDYHKIHRMKTRAQVKKELDFRGESLSEWARANGFHRATVYDVVAGRLQGKRGISHKIAVKLGLKEGVVIDG